MLHVGREPALIAGLSILIAATALLAQPAPPAEGGAEFVFRSSSTGKRLFLAYDLGSRSVVLHRIGQEGDRVWYRDADGRMLTQRLGESAFVEASERDAFMCDILMLTESVPAVASLALSMLDADQYTSQPTDDGGRRVDVSLISGSLGFTVIDDPSHARLPRIEATYIIDAQDRIRSVVIGPGSEPLVAIDPGRQDNYLAWVFETPDLTDVEVSAWVASVDSLIKDSESVMPRLLDVALQNAEASRYVAEQSRATPEGQQEFRESVARVEAPGLIDRSWIPLVLTGVVLVGVGAFAWWKRR